MEASMASRCVGVAAALLATMNVSETGRAQVEHAPWPVASITTEEKLLIERTVLFDPRTRAIVGEGQPRITSTDVHVDKAEAEAFLTGKSATLPTRRVTVVLVNPRTQQAARSLIELSQNQVLTVESIPASDVPFLPDEAREALALAKTDVNVRRAIGDSLDRYVILESGNEARIPFA